MATRVGSRFGGLQYNNRLQPTIASVTTLADARLAPATLAAEANVRQACDGTNGISTGIGFTEDGVYCNDVL